MLQWRRFSVFWILALAVLLFAQHRRPAPEHESVNAIFDLTHTIHENAPSFDASERFHATTTSTVEKNGYYARLLSLPEHFGTHIDAPAHFTPGTWTVDEIPAERLVRPLAVIDIAAKAKENPDYALTVDDIALWEDAHGHIPLGAVVALRTGWSERWLSPKAFVNADAKGVMHFPGFSLEAAQFLVEARAAVGLGTDTSSIDPGIAASFPVHKYSSQKSVYHLESLAGLEITPETGMTVVVAPAKVRGGSGAPARVLAMQK